MTKIAVVLLGFLALSQLGQTMSIIEAEEDANVDATISTDVNDLLYLAYESASNVATIDFNNINSLKAANIQSGRDVVITIDGFLSNSTSPMTRLVREGFLNRGNENYIVLDWSELSGSRANVGNPILMAGAYLKVLNNVGPIGHRLAQFLELLEEEKGIPLGNVHLVGGSLGAHIAGAAGSYIRNKYGAARIGRITGLDPAGPFFSMQVDKNKRLHSGDALFVDIYHSNRGTLGDSEHGTGDINIYLNGGNNQPGCAEADKANSGVCSHAFAFKTFRHAFENNVEACPCATDSACTCNTCSYDCAAPISLGPDTPTSTRGRYHASVDEL